jgi:thiamine biosynthesis lipoprotein
MHSTKSKTKPKHSWSFAAIGTQWSIDIYDAAEHLEDLQDQIQQRIATFDETYSRFRDDSWVSKLARKDGTYDMPSDMPALIDWYRQLYDATDHAVTPLIGKLMSDAGYDTDYSLRPKQLQAVPKWDDVIEQQGDTLIVKRPVLLDFGAAGKGYLIDLLTKLLVQNGVRNFVIDGSGDILCQGVDNLQTIGLENPWDSTQIIGLAHVANGALCASAGNRRQWGEFNHIMNPSTLTSETNVAATWAIAKTAMQADGLATALFFTEPEKLQQFGFEYVILYADGHARYSTNWPGELF